MDPEQFSRLLTVLIKIADKKQAITESVDWPLLVTIVGMFGTILLAMLGMMWFDLKSGFAKHQQYDDKEHDKLWSAMKDCQKDFCPPRRRKGDE
jgi:hypothetical protein